MTRNDDFREEKTEDIEMTLTPRENTYLSSDQRQNCSAFDSASHPTLLLVLQKLGIKIGTFMVYTYKYCFPLIFCDLTTLL